MKQRPEMILGEHLSIELIVDMVKHWLYRMVCFHRYRLVLYRWIPAKRGRRG